MKTILFAHNSTTKKNLSSQTEYISSEEFNMLPNNSRKKSYHGISKYFPNTYT